MFEKIRKKRIGLLVFVKGVADRSRAVNVRIDHNVDAGRLARGTSPFQCRADVLRFGDVLPVASHILDDPVVAGWSQKVGNVAAGLSIA